MIRNGLMLLLLLIISPLQAQSVNALVGPPAATPLTGERQERETERVASLLRCPVCQGLSINDSPATMAVQMKAQTRELLSAGYSDEQIITYYEKSYGQFVRLEPPRAGINWIVWLAPGVLLLGGIVFLISKVRKKSPSEAPLIEPATLDEDLAPWVMRIREMAYGDEARER